jgi:hypothetical protein
MYVSFPAHNPRKETFSAGMTVQIYGFTLIQQNFCGSFFNDFSCVRTQGKNENENEDEDENEDENKDENRKEDGDHNENEDEDENIRAIRVIDFRRAKPSCFKSFRE